MLIGLIIYLSPRRSLPDSIAGRAGARAPLDRAALQASARSLLFLPVSLFWATYEQQGNTIALWTNGFTDQTSIGFEIPTTWFQSFNPFMIFAFTPFVVALWAAGTAGTSPRRF